MTTSTGHSLWLMPSDQIYNQLSNTISQLSNQYATPVFQPHITLLGDVTGDVGELSSQAQQLALRLRRFQVTLTTVDYLPAYFRCLFIRAEETSALVEANRIARELFHREQDAKFMPHLSLMYGDFDLETKQQIIASIGREFKMTFSVNRIHLLSCNGEPKAWYHVREFEIPDR
jgi:2'-5' RNA ligase